MVQEWSVIRLHPWGKQMAMKSECAMAMKSEHAMAMKSERSMAMKSVRLMARKSAVGWMAVGWVPAMVPRTGSRWDRRMERMWG
jgi:hypothetical protein